MQEEASYSNQHMKKVHRRSKTDGNISAVPQFMQPPQAQENLGTALISNLNAVANQ